MSSSRKTGGALVRLSVGMICILALATLAAAATALSGGREVSERNATFVLILVSAIGLIVLAFGLLAARRHTRSLQAPERSFRERIADVRQHMTQARELMTELEDELTTRSEALEQLQSDAERYEQLATMSTEQAQAIEDLVGRQFQRQARTSAVQWWLSVVLAIVFGFLVNWLSTPVWNWITR